MPSNDHETPKSSLGGRTGALVLAALAVGAMALFGLDRMNTPGSSGATHLAGLPALAGEPASFTDEQKHGIEKVVKDYLLANPELFLEVQGALEAKMEKEQAEKTKALVSENAKEIYRHPNAAVAGNPNGD